MGPDELPSSYDELRADRNEVAEAMFARLGKRRSWDAWDAWNTCDRIYGLLIAALICPSLPAEARSELRALEDGVILDPIFARIWQVIIDLLDAGHDPAEGMDGEPFEGVSPYLDEWIAAGRRPKTGAGPHWEGTSHFELVVRDHLREVDPPEDFSHDNLEGEFSHAIGLTNLRTVEQVRKVIAEARELAAEMRGEAA